MKMLNMLVLAGLMGSSVAAMAEDGGDIVAARMDAARDHAMAHYQQEQQAQAVAATHDQAQTSTQQQPQAQKAGS